MDGFQDGSDHFTGPKLGDAAHCRAEKKLGYKLPERYVSLLRVRNGGTPKRPYFHVEGLAGWDTGHLQIDSLRGIGHERWSIDTNDMGDHYPDVGLRVCDTPSGGHDAAMLDYSLCGPEGELRVVHAARGCDADEVTILAPDFAAFMAALSDCHPERAG